MTRKEIERKLEAMLLHFNPVGNREHSIKHGYWEVPVEKYKFKVIAGPVKDTWEIRIESNETSMVYSAEDGIQWIQDLIKDKMEEQVDRLSGSWTNVHMGRALRYHARVAKQLFINSAYITKKHGKNHNK